LILLTSEQIDSNPPYASALGANNYLTKLIKLGAVNPSINAQLK
jgi:hypothetical protein